MIGTTIKDFKLVERLGKGGWGEVWAAEQPIVKTRVAIKLLRSEVSGDQAHVQRFFNEARAVGGIPHAGIVKIFDVGYQGQQAFLIMELLAGESLTARIRRESRVPLDEVLDIARQIASVLGATHEAGVVHRDLKPDNVFLIPDAEIGERVKILDFGIAKLSEVNVTGTGSLGTPAYMAPEQWSSPATADHRADLYSLGCVLFEMCCGRPPFLAITPGEACTKHLTEQPPRARELAPALPIELDDLIDRLLAKRAEDRPSLMDVDRVLGAAQLAAPRVVRNRPRASNPPFRTSSTGGKRNAITDHGTAETLENAATVTSLAGAVIAQTQPQRRSRAPMVLGGIAVFGIAGAIAFAVTREGEPVATEPPVVEPEPAQGLATIAEYVAPTPATVINHRSEQVWLAAQDDFERACKRAAKPRWCAGAAFAEGEIALMRDHLPQSIEAFQRATTLDPEWSTGYLGLSDALAHVRDKDKSLAAARRAQTLDPTGWQPAMAMARALIAAGETEDALIEYRRAMSKSPPNNAVMLAEIALAFHYAAKDDEAKRIAEQARKLDTRLVNIHLMSAELALEAKQGAEALSEADRALAMSPKNGAALIVRADALTMLGRGDEALAEYRRALQLRGGMNLLAISKKRLAIVTAAVERGELPAARGEVAERAQPPSTETVLVTKPLPSAPSGAERSPPNPGPTVPRAASVEERSPPPPPPVPSGNNEPDRSPPSLHPSDGPERSPPNTQPTPSAQRSPPDTTAPGQRAPPAKRKADDRTPPTKNKPPTERALPRPDL